MSTRVVYLHPRTRNSGQSVWRLELREIRHVFTDGKEPPWAWTPSPHLPMPSSRLAGDVRKGSPGDQKRSQSLGNDSDCMAGAACTHRQSVHPLITRMFSDRSDVSFNVVFIHGEQTVYTYTPFAPEQVLLRNRARVETAGRGLGTTARGCGGS